MKKLILFLIVIIVLNAHAQQKVALVIGNNNYKEYPLKNAANDANLMERTLKQLGFTVQKVLNASKTEFEKQLALFNRTYKNADVRLFYYAGHGIQLDGENYLVPVDAVLEEKEDVKLEGIDFSVIFSIFQKSKPDAMNIFVMDACRNNPFKNRSWGGRGGDDRGLILKKSDFTAGSFAAFSADNGQKASDGTINNGLYTQVLAKELLVPGVEINILFQKVRNKVIQLSNGEQSPVEENRLVSDNGFYFIPAINNKPVIKPEPKPTELFTKYYYYVDQNGNENEQHFITQKDAETYMKQNKLYGKIYSNDGEIFVVDAPAKPTVIINENSVQDKLDDAQKYFDNKIYDKAFAIYNNLSEQNMDFNAMLNIATLYFNGNGVTKNFAKGKYWFQKADDKEDEMTKDTTGKKYWWGMNHLENYFGVTKDEFHAIYWMRQDITNSKAMAWLGYFYEYGYGVTQDYVEAKTWYQRAANIGNDWAKKKLANWNH